MAKLDQFLTIIRNGYLSQAAEVSVPRSKLLYNLAVLLKKNGYLAKVISKKSDPYRLKLELKYSNDQPVLTQLKQISKPGRRIYRRSQDLKPYRSGYGMTIVSTPQGLMTAVEARKKGLGGEVICSIF